MISNGYFPATGMPDKDWWRTLWLRPEQVVSDMGIEAGMDVVDICCGDGYFTAPMAHLAAPGRVTGIDLDPVLLKEARAACERLTNCSLVEGDVLQLRQLMHEPVDYAFFANTFHGVPNQTDFAGIVHSVLKPAGRFGIVNWHARPREQTIVLGQPRGPKSEMRMSPAVLRKVLEPAGFTLARVIELRPYHYGAVFIANH